MPFIFPASIIFMFSSISLVFEASSFFNSLASSTSLLFIWYQFLYHKCKLEIFFISFLSFVINHLIFFLYLLSLYALANGFPDPIYVEQITVLSQYRYLLLSLLFFIILSFFILKHFSESVSSLFTILTYPYLKEEVRKFLYLWVDSFFCLPFLRVIDLLASSRIFRITYFTGHFIFFSGLRFLMLIFFVRFVFFHGDFRHLIYLAPLSFTIWILSYLDYYFNAYFKGCFLRIRELLNVELIREPTKKVSGIIYANANDFSFCFTPVALEHGYRTEKHISVLADLWFQYGRLDVHFSSYAKKTRVFSLLYISIQVICWLSVVNYFFVWPCISFSAGFDLLLRLVPKIPSNVHARSFHSTARLCHPPSEIRAIDVHAQQKLAQQTDGAYAPGHVVIVDPTVRNPDDPTEILFEGTITKGKATQQNPSHVFDSSQRVNGTPGVQRYVPPKTNPEYIKESITSNNAVKDSVNYMQKNKVAHAAHMPEKEET